MLWRDLHGSIRRALDRRTHLLDVLSARVSAAAGTQEITSHRRRLIDLRARLIRAHDTHRNRARDSVASLTQRLAAADPLLILQRGFSYTTQADGSVIRSSKDVRAGERIATHVADGSFDSIVQPSGTPERSGRAHDRGRGNHAKPGQLDLFHPAGRVTPA